jgi:sRNA-binding regulator protein Hfq
VNGKNNGKNGNPQYKPKNVGKKPQGGSKGHGGNSGGGAKSSRAPEQTFEEVRYLKYLIDQAIPVRIKLRDNTEVSGTIEYYDRSFVRLTRDNEPNLFIFKHEIKYLYEQ